MPNHPDHLAVVMNAAATFIAAEVRATGIDAVMNPTVRDRAVRGALELWDETLRQVREADDGYTPRRLAPTRAR